MAFSAAVVLGIVFAASPAFAKDGKCNGLPTAVKDAIAAAFPNAEIEEFKAETENGVALYEVEIEIADDEMDVSVTADGQIVEIESEVSLEDVPGPVAAALQKEAGGGEIEEISKEEMRATLKDGVATMLAAAVVSYEAEISKEIGLDANGNLLPEEDDEDDVDVEDEDEEEEEGHED
ncbi:MAG: hypothetical protein PHD86_01445 [Kiritimatiellae bacterium]|nr:hypothetical protein [Kiritimatiellia bacterium]